MCIKNLCSLMFQLWNTTKKRDLSNDGMSKTHHKAQVGLQQQLGLRNSNRAKALFYETSFR